MSIFQLEQMTWTDVEQLDKENTVLFLPVSPIEEHGPHLPLGTDIFCARDIAAEAANLIISNDPQVNVVLAPSIPLGCSPSTADFPGTISLQGETLKRVIFDVCDSLANHGFRYFVISNHHMDPIHMKAILSAIKELKEKHGIRIIETCSQADPFSAVEKQDNGLEMHTEIHADVKETSYILHSYPHLCRSIYKDLSPEKINIIDGFRKGLTTFRQMGAESGYIGSPARASADMGRRYLEKSVKKVAALALGLLAV